MGPGGVRGFKRFDRFGDEDGSFLFTPPDDVEKFVVEVWGGGGAGGYARAVITVNGGFGFRTSYRITVGGRGISSVPNATPGQPSMIGTFANGSWVRASGGSGATSPGKGGFGGDCNFKTSEVFGAFTTATLCMPGGDGEFPASPIGGASGLSFGNVANGGRGATDAGELKFGDAGGWGFVLISW